MFIFLRRISKPKISVTLLAVLAVSSAPGLTRIEVGFQILFCCVLKFLMKSVWNNGRNEQRRYFRVDTIRVLYAAYEFVHSPHRVSVGDAAKNWI